MAGRRDSFVAETDVSLLRDAMRCLIRTTGRAAAAHDVAGRRQRKHLAKTVKRLFDNVRSTGRAGPERVEAHPDRCRGIVLRVEGDLPAPAANGASARTVTEIGDFLAHALRQTTARAGPRLPRGETVPRHEKAFSILKPHTRRIPKGRAGRPVEPGVPVCIPEDRHG